MRGRGDDDLKLDGVFPEIEMTELQDETTSLGG